MTDRVANSSDLSSAREASRRLSRIGKAGTAPLAAGGYVRLVGAGASQELTAERPPSLMSRPPASAEPEVAPRQFDSWELCLAWCERETGADAAFVIDSQGFVIGAVGAIAVDGFVALGAELCLAFEELERIDPTAGRLHWIDLEFSKRRVVGLQVRSAGRDPFIVAIRSPQVDYAARRATIEQVIIDSLARIT